MILQTVGIAELVFDTCVQVPNWVKLDQALQGRGVSFVHGGYCRYLDPALFKTHCHIIKELIRAEDPDFTATKVAGGGAANVTRNMQMLGECQPTIIGIEGDDKYASKCRQSLENAGVDCTGLLTRKGTKTLRCFPFFWQGRRTMFTLDQKTDKICGEDLTSETFHKPYQLLLLEGYGVFAKNQLSRATKLTKDSIPYRALILPGSGVIADEAKKELLQLIQSEGLTHIFGNLEEFQALTDGKNSDDIRKWMQSYQKLSAVCTNGEHGGWVFFNGECMAYSAVPAICNDDTGAGDGFTAGYLWAMLKGHAPQQCAAVGACVASHVVQYIGGILPSEAHEQVRNDVEKLLKETSS